MHDYQEENSPEELQVQQPGHPPKTALGLGGRLLSEVAAELLAEAQRDGLAKVTRDEKRSAFLKLFRYLGCDPPLRDLTADTPAEFVRWLRATPRFRNPQGSVPRSIDRPSIQRYLERVRSIELPALPPPEEKSLSRDWTWVSQLLRRAGLDTSLTRRDRFALDDLPVRLPALDVVAARWQDLLGKTATMTWIDGRDAWRVVRVQALLMLTGMRLGECLAARREDLEGRWLLLRKTKTKPRVIYVSRQALGIAASLRRRPQQLLFEDPDSPAFAGWDFTESAWHAMAKQALKPIGDRLPERPQQQMRQICSTYLEIDCGMSLAESIQLGHGKEKRGVKGASYVDAMARLPELLEGLAGRLPSLDRPWPDPADVELHMPDERHGGIWDELRRLVHRRPERD